MVAGLARETQAEVACTQALKFPGVEKTLYKLIGLELCKVLHLEVLLTGIISLHPAACDSCNILKGILPPVQHCLQQCG